MRLRGSFFEGLTENRSRVFFKSLKMKSLAIFEKELKKMRKLFGPHDVLLLVNARQTDQPHKTINQGPKGDRK